MFLHCITTTGILCTVCSKHLILFCSDLSVNVCDWLAMLHSWWWLSLCSSCSLTLISWSFENTDLCNSVLLRTNSDLFHCDSLCNAFISHGLRLLPLFSLHAARAKEFRMNFSDVLQGTLSRFKHPLTQLYIYSSIKHCVLPSDVTKLL